MNMTKSHRIVLLREAFNRIANIESGAAMECAENEGWPIQADERELPYVVANAGVMALAHRQASEHVESGVYFWSGWAFGWQSRPMRASTLLRKRRLFAVVRRIGRTRSAVFERS